MRRLVLSVCLAASAVALLALPGDNVVSSNAVGLRLRSQPTTSAPVVTSLGRGEEALALGKTDSSDRIDGLTAPWYRVLMSTGQIGWAFGGYLAAEKVWPDSLFLGAEQEATTSQRSYSSGFDNGKLVLVRVSRSDRSDPNLFPTLEVLFVKTPAGAPQVVLAQETGSGYEGSALASLDRLETLDVVGDRRMEICATVTTRSEDGGMTECQLYGAAAGSDRYTMLGSIVMSDSDVGDTPRASAVKGGLHFVRDGGRRLIKAVRVTSSPALMSLPDEDHPEGQPLSGTREETYEMRGPLLLLTETKDIAPGNP
jgi:hypothetical protein